MVYVLYIIFVISVRGSVCVYKSLCCYLLTKHYLTGTRHGKYST